MSAGSLAAINATLAINAAATAHRLNAHKGGWPSGGGGGGTPWGPILLLAVTALLCFAFLFWARMGFPGWS